MSDAVPLFDSGFLSQLDRLALLTRRPTIGQMHGERRSPRRGSSVEYADFKPYTAGDDFRQIDWNLYARLEKFFLKLFVAEEEITLHLLVDTGASMDWGEPNKLRYAAQAAGALGYIALAGMDRAQVTGFGAGVETRIPAGRGRAGVAPLFKFLGNLKGNGATSLLDGCRRYAQSARTAGPLLLCSDLLTEDWQEALRTLGRRPFEITVMHILSPDELNPPLEGDLKLLDAEGGAPLDISADLDLLQRYVDRLHKWREEVEDFCTGRGINYIFVDTTMVLQTLLVSVLRERQIVR